jgi:hypothetical protein
MKGLLLGILLIVLTGIGGFVYRNVVERSIRPIACPLDTLVCPDGTAVSRTGFSCKFPACPPPNVSLPDINISFALPAGLAAGALPDETSVAAYELPSATSSISAGSIVIRRYAFSAPSTAFTTIRQTAIGSPSGLPIGATQFTSTMLGNHRFTVVSIERFEGVIDTAYYLARGTDVLRFDAIDREVVNWTDSRLNVPALPAHAALVKLLATLQDQ